MQKINKDTLHKTLSESDLCIFKEKQTKMLCLNPD